MLVPATVLVQTGQLLPLHLGASLAETAQKLDIIVKLILLDRVVIILVVC